MSSPPPLSILTLNNDALMLICDCFPTNHQPTESWSPLKALSLTCQRLHALAKPVLLRNLRIKRQDRDCMRDDLMALEQCSDAKRYARTFALPCMAPFDLELSNKLATTLLSLTNLHTVQLEVATVAPWHPFETKHFQLPSVKTLIIAAANFWLAPLCPNLEDLAGTESSWGGEEVESLIAATSGLSRLQRLALKAPWTTELLLQISQTHPDLRSLGMTNSRPRFRIPFSALISILAQFKQLQSLVLPRIATMGVGYDPPMCGNAFHGPKSAELRASLKRKRKEVEESLARDAFTLCKMMEEIWFGKHSKAVVTREDDGRVDTIVMSEERSTTRWDLARY